MRIRTLLALSFAAVIGFSSGARAARITDGGDDPSTPSASNPGASPGSGTSTGGTTSTPSVTLTWTAPGDSLSGIASFYDLRYSTNPISETMWPFAVEVGNLPLPGAPGTQQSITIDGLTSGVTYYFAIRSADAYGNWSGLSNLAVRSSDVVGTGPKTSPPDGIEFAPPAPNPARSVTRFAFALPRAARLEARVFDVTGRLVRTLATGERPAGRASLEWDLADDRGQPLAAGVYLVRADVAGQLFSRRVVVVR